LTELKEVAAWVKSNGGNVRINTSGHANLVYKRDITKELKGLVDAISISLNATSQKQYSLLHNPAFGTKAFNEVVNFAKNQ
ncbi:MAG: hypothetical protein RIS64_106, partial [Bacteroidota bacterium]